jgi:hypothetical protein
MNAVYSGLLAPIFYSLQHYVRKTLSTGIISLRIFVGLRIKSPEKNGTLQVNLFLTIRHSMPQNEEIKV